MAEVFLVSDCSTVEQGAVGLVTSKVTKHHDYRWRLLDKIEESAAVGSTSRLSTNRVVTTKKIKRSFLRGKIFRYSSIILLFD